MITKKKTMLYGFAAAGIIFIIIAFSAATRKADRLDTNIRGKTYKILHIMSYHTPWEWTDEQIKGFKAGLGDISYEFDIISMDGKKHSDRASLLKKSGLAQERILKWIPDLVYTSDDIAAEYVIQKNINTDLPFVFSGLNADPKKYGITGSLNVTGIVEYEHFVQTINLLREIKPKIRRIAVAYDDDPAWSDVIYRCRLNAKKFLPGITFIRWDEIRTFREYKSRIKEYENIADALLILGWFNFKDDNGVNVNDTAVAKWTAENSRIPDASLWKDRVIKGTLCSVYVSAFEQGYDAGKDARKILTEHTSPSNIPITPANRGKPVISLYRAKKLGISINSTTLLKSEILDKASWE